MPELEKDTFHLQSLGFNKKNDKKITNSPHSFTITTIHMDKNIH